MKEVSSGLITFSSAHRDPPSLHAPCLGLLCCPFVSQDPEFGAETRAALPKARPNTLERKHSIEEGGKGAWRVGSQKVEQHISLLAL